jgi:ABC-type multidrug transport system fused ATPase/permease subunit
LEQINLRAARQAYFERSIQRLDRHLAALDSLERRFVWYRLAVVMLGAGLTWWAAVQWGPRVGWLAVLVSLAVFVLVVALHNRLIEGMRRFKLWREQRQAQLARLNLDWDHIPAGSPLPGPRVALDIDLDLTGPGSLHHLLDLAVSQGGSQRLADWLTYPDPDLPQVTERQAVVRELSGLSHFRDRLLLNLRMVSRAQLQGEGLVSWLSVVYPDRRLKGLFILGALFCTLNAALFVLNLLGVLPPIWPFTLAAYGLFYFSNVATVTPFLSSVVDLDRELGKFGAIVGLLERYPLQRQPHLARLCAIFRDPQNLPSGELRRIRWVTAGVGMRSNPILGFLVNLLLPWDFGIALLAGRLRRRAAAYLPGWLEAWYRLEALISLANLAYLNPEYTFPRFAPDVSPVFHTRELGHPLIQAGRKIVNDFDLPEFGQVMILTGSNMSGKSTFIKTVGINLCLAYAGGPVNAAELCTRPFRLHTCIRITDSIADGFSYFYAEVKCLKSLMQKLGEADSPAVLYLIDEIFRGTNNRERLIGSRAYMQSLIAAHGVGLIATHDLELASLADDSPQVQNFHFRDAVAQGVLVFDYKLRHGPCPTTNALKIMAMEGLPTGADTAAA